MPDVTVACVLRSGGRVYGPEWVHALAAGVRQHLPGARFACLSDVHVPGVPTIRLEHGWPGWWAKVELFRPGLFPGRVVYLDLDTLPVGDMTDLGCYDGPLATLSDFYRPEHMASGVILFDPDAVGHVYDAFRRDPEGIIAAHPDRSDFWYARVLGDPDRIQDLYPHQVVSLKAHARQRAPGGARLVCGHGPPRFSSPEAGWAHELWTRRAA